MRILFICEAVSLAHVTRPIMLASALDENKWDVWMASSGAYDFCFKNKKWPKKHLNSLSPDDFFHRSLKGAEIYTHEELLQYVEDDLRLFKEVKPDVVIGDLRVSLSISARVAGIPYAAICNAYWSQFSKEKFFCIQDIPFKQYVSPYFFRYIFPIAGSLVSLFNARPLNLVRGHYGLQKLSSYHHTLTDGDLTIYADIPGFVPLSSLPENHAFIGPVLWSPEQSPPIWWKELPNENLVYFSLGSTGNINCSKPVINVILKSGYSVMLATAGRFDSDEYFNNKIYQAPFLPGLLASQKADFVICNGGSPTVYQALSCGKPVIGIYTNTDQFLTMHYVELAGCGIGLHDEKLTEKKLENAIFRIKSDRRFLECAMTIKRKFSLYKPEAIFPELLCKLAINAGK